MRLPTFEVKFRTANIIVPAGWAFPVEMLWRLQCYPKNRIDAESMATMDSLQHRVITIQTAAMADKSWDQVFQPEEWTKRGCECRQANKSKASDDTLKSQNVSGTENKRKAGK